MDEPDILSRHEDAAKLKKDPQNKQDYLEFEKTSEEDPKLAEIRLKESLKESEMPALTIASAASKQTGICL